MLRQKQQALERRESSTFRRGPRQKGQVIDPHSLSQALTVAAQHLLGQAEQPTPITLAPAVLRPARLSAEADSLEEVADWITPAPVQWATDLGQDRADLGATMAQTLSCHPDVARVDIDEQSGFLLITLTDVARGEAVRDVLRSIPMMPADAAPADHADTATRVERRDAADVQYAHATMCRVIRTAEAAGVPADAGADLSLLTTAAERALLVLLADHTQRRSAPLRARRGRGARLAGPSPADDRGRACDPSSRGPFAACGRHSGDLGLRTRVLGLGRSDQNVTHARTRGWSTARRGLWGCPTLVALPR